MRRAQDFRKAYVIVVRLEFQRRRTLVINHWLKVLRFPTQKTENRRNNMPFNKRGTYMTIQALNLMQAYLLGPRASLSGD